MNDTDSRRERRDFALSGAPVGVLPEQAGIFFVQADGVLDRDGRPRLSARWASK